MKVQSQEQQTYQSSAFYAPSVNLRTFKIARFIFDFSAIESGNLPDYKGNILRGGFGHTFRGIACQNKDSECKSCVKKANCAYLYIFETLGEDAPKSQTIDKFFDYSDVPRPFVIDSSDAWNRDFARGDPLQFSLTLIGKAIEYFPYFVFCFDELGRRGMGINRVRFRLENISSYDFQSREYSPVYDPTSRLLSEKLPVISADQLPYECDNRLSLEFLTPTRIKYRESYITDMEFHVMIRNLLRRIAMLMLFHCDAELVVDFKELISRAKMVDVREWRLKWCDWERYSTRHKVEMNLGGFIGTVTYEGDLDKFMPLVALGEYIHIGKHTTFGLGKYHICNRKSVDKEGDVP